MGGYGPAKHAKDQRDGPYDSSEFSTPAQEANGQSGHGAVNLPQAPAMPQMTDISAMFAQLTQMLDSKLTQMDSKLDSKLDPLISRVDSQDTKILKIESDLASLHSKFDDVSLRDVPMGEGSKDAMKAEILAELRAEGGGRTIIASKSAPATPRVRTLDSKYAYNQGDIETAMVRLEFQLNDVSVALKDVEAKMFAMIAEKCPQLPKPTVVKSAFSFPNQTSKRIHFEFETKEDRNTARNSFRQKNANNQWESCVEGVEVWCPEPAFLFHRNRPLLEMRRLIASQKGVSVQAVKVDKNGRKLTLDGKMVALQNLKTWQVDPVSEEETR